MGNLKAQDLRIGNLVEYRIEDELDSRKEWWEVTAIDSDDINWLEKESPESTDYRPIPLTEEWLLKFDEMKKFGSTIYIPIMNLKAEIHFEIYGNEIVSTIKSDFANLILDRIKYVHQLQNLYFALSGTELNNKHPNIQ